MDNIPTILTCVDTTNPSITALRYACYRAKKLGFSLQVLAVMENSHKNMLFGSKAISQDKKKHIEKHLQKLLDDLHKEIQIVPAVSIREGDIATEIAREIKSIPNCVTLFLGKSYNPLSDNTVLPKIIQKIGDKIRIPVTIIPENLSEDYFKALT